MLRQPSRLIVMALVAATFGSPWSGASAQVRMSTVALFPVENLSAGAIPGPAVSRHLHDTLTTEGVRVLEADALEAFLAQHRVRYTAGIDAGTAELLRKATGVEGVLIPSVERVSDVVPAKVAVFARIVSISAAPVVVWAEGVAVAGDEAPGLFELGLVNDPQVVFARALDRLSASLAGYLRTGQAPSGPAAASHFRPKSTYRDIVLEPGRSYSVAVVPFFNLSERRNAGEIMALHYVRQLSAHAQFRVADLGATRRQLLDARIIMDGGLSISDAELVASLVEADFVLAGRVLRYEDYDGSEGRAAVEFSATLIDRRSRRVVWSSESYNEGHDGVGIFGRGGSKTAHAMAAQMVKQTTAQMAGRH